MFETQNVSVSRRSRTLIIIAAALIVCVGFGVWKANANSEAAREIAELESAQSEAIVSVGVYHDQVNALNEEISTSETLLSGSEGKVSDEKTRTDLQAAIDIAKTVDIDRSFVIDPDGSVEMLVEIEQSADSHAKSVSEQIDALIAARDSVSLSMVEKPLKVYKANVDKAESATMVNSYGKVTDNKVRDDLQAQIDAGKKIITEAQIMIDNGAAAGAADMISSINGGNSKLQAAVKKVDQAVTDKTNADNAAAEQAPADNGGYVEPDNSYSETYSGGSGYSEYSSGYSEDYSYSGGGSSSGGNGGGNTYTGGGSSGGNTGGGSSVSNGGNSSNGGDNPFEGNDCFDWTPGGDFVQVPC